MQNVNTTYSEVYLSKNLLIFLLKTLLRSLMYVISPPSASSLARLFLALEFLRSYL